jgi:hypothetical protein
MHPGTHFEALLHEISIIYSSEQEMSTISQLQYRKLSGKNQFVFISVSSSRLAECQSFVSYFRRANNRIQARKKACKVYETYVLPRS